MANDHGDFGYEKGSTWHKIMTEGTQAEKKALDKWLDEARADARAMEGWARADGESIEQGDHEGGDNQTRDTLTPDVDAYLQKRRGVLDDE